MIVWFIVGDEYIDEFEGFEIMIVVIKKYIMYCCMLWWGLNFFVVFCCVVFFCCDLVMDIKSKKYVL